MVDAPLPPNTSAAWTLLRQSDFAAGTYRITRSGRYRLAENVSFRPNPNNDFRPTAAQSAQYPTTGAEGAFRLGFFAAITVEASDVVLDLGGFSLRQHPDHALQQRFFALIETADQPFLPSVGPADFGATIQSAKRLVIQNGQLGLSSHHGIHGNDNTDVLLQNLTFVNFEVAAVSLNGARRVRIEHCHVLGTRRDVPVLGVYSAARFLRPLLDRLDSGATITLRGQVWTRDQLIARLDAATDSVFRRKPIASAKFFINDSGLTDGPVYGLLINKRGVAVNKFACCSDVRGDTYARDVAIVDTRVERIEAKPREVVALSQPGARTAQTGAFGEVLPIVDIAAKGTGAYVGTVLSDAQLLLAKHTALTKIDPAVVAWAESGGSLAQVMRANGMHYLPNGDSMFHVLKGVLGIRCDGVSKLLISNVSVAHVRNRGAIGTTLSGEYFGSGLGHPNQNDDSGFGGNQVRGIAIAKCWSSQLQHLQLCNVVSDTGPAWGIEVMNDADLLRMDRINIINVHACANDTPGRSTTIPNSTCSAIGLDVHEVLKSTITRVRITQLRGRSISFVRSPFQQVTSGPVVSFSMAYDYPNRQGWYLNRLRQ